MDKRSKETQFRNQIVTLKSLNPSHDSRLIENFNGWRNIITLLINYNNLSIPMCYRNKR